MSAEIAVTLVKKLRDKTGAGIMDCKAALAESGGDEAKALQFLREKGLADAQKRAGRTAAEGIISSYVHMGGKIGVLTELNCETDFVARTDDFRGLAREISMQVAASNPRFISREDVSEEALEAERSIYRAQALESGKPENIVDKIVEGKLNKLFYKTVCLLEQDYVRDPDKTIQDLISETIAKTGENIVVRRFMRFQMGEDSGE